MLRTVRGLLTDPRGAFASGSVDDHPVLGRPLLVLFALGVATLGAAFAPVLFSAPAQLPGNRLITYAVGDSAVAFPRRLAEVALLLLVAPFVFCLYVTLLTLVPTKLLGALAAARRDGLPAGRPSAASVAAFARRQGRSLVRTYALVAVGFLPQFAATVFTGTALVVAVATGADAADGLVRLTPAGHLLSVVDGAPAVTAATHAVGAVATLASGYLWVGAVGRATGVSRRRAAVVVGPVTVLLIYVSDLAGNLGL